MDGLVNATEISVRISGIPDGIQTLHRWSTSLESYLYVSMPLS
jgi:hypothetical protein